MDADWFSEKMRNLPVRPWPCDGCRFVKLHKELRHKDGTAAHLYRCTFQMPSVPGLSRPQHVPDMTYKRLYGPHEGEPVVCDARESAQ